MTITREVLAAAKTNSVIQRAIRMAQEFQSDIFLSVGSLTVDAKSSLMALMFLSAARNRPVLVTAEGADADKAVAALSGVFERSPEGTARVPHTVRVLEVSHA